MKASLLMMFTTVTDDSFTATATTTLANGSMESGADTASWLIRLEGYMRVSGSIASTWGPEEIRKY